MLAGAPHEVRVLYILSVYEWVVRMNRVRGGEMTFEVTGTRDQKLNAGGCAGPTNAGDKVPVRRWSENEMNL